MTNPFEHLDAQSLESRLAQVGCDETPNPLDADKGESIRDILLDDIAADIEIQFAIEQAWFNSIDTNI